MNVVQETLPLNPTVTDEITLDEIMDAIDPLRHLRNQDSLTDCDERIIPAQPHTIQNETIQLSFSKFLQNERSILIQVTLKVDASPGCGGIAWPAGEVRFCDRPFTTSV